MIYQARISISIVSDDIETHDLTIPVHIPSVESVRAFALGLHESGDAWQGVFQGWEAEYKPQSDKPLNESSAPFDPAYFVIGDSRIWIYALDWENGKDASPSSELNDIGRIVPMGTKHAGELIHPTFA